MSLSVIGWVGTCLYLINHGLLSFGRIERGRTYYAVNGTAAALVTVSSVSLGSSQAVVVNGFWVVVSVLGLLQISLPLLRGTQDRHLFWLCAAIAVGALAIAIQNPTLAIRVLGWSGTILFCGGYLLFAAGRMENGPFLMANAVAAFILLPVLVLDTNWPVVALESVWGILSTAGWLKLRHDEKKRAG
ncbi:MAG: hypothetical protein AAF610_07985 [Pseudomonadota bacterium]